MNPVHRMPLYLGLAVFIIAILVSAVKIGQSRSLSQLGARAGIAPYSLRLTHTENGWVSVLLNVDRPVAGVDVSIRIPSLDATILPSSLAAGPGYIVSGGSFDEATRHFTFSAVAIGENQTGLVAKFQTGPMMRVENIPVELEFDTSEGATEVIERTTGNSLDVSTQGVRFTLERT